MPHIRSVAVFCGSRFGASPAYRRGAEALGLGLAQAGIRLIYGGGRVGLMGVVADAVLDGGGQVLGVIPEFLTRQEVAHPRVIDLTVTDSMHSRKQRMFELSDVFVMMPGGLGTLDEIVEIITWRQLKLHDKPILICNLDGAASALVAAFEAVVRMGFADVTATGLYEVIDTVPALLDRLQHLEAAAPASARPL